MTTRRSVFRIMGLALAVIYLAVSVLSSIRVAISALSAQTRGRMFSLDSGIPGLPELHDPLLIALLMTFLGILYAVLLVGLLRKWRIAQYIVFMRFGLMALRGLLGILGLVFSKIPPLELGLVAYGISIFMLLVGSVIAICVALELFRPVQPSCRSTP